MAMNIVTFSAALLVIIGFVFTGRPDEQAIRVIQFLYSCNDDTAIGIDIAF